MKASAWVLAVTVQYSAFAVFESPVRAEPMSADATAACVRAVAGQAKQQMDAYVFPPTSRPWTDVERTAGTAVLRKVYEFKRNKMRECLTEKQAEACGRVDIFILRKVGQACGITTTPAAADVIEGAAAGSMTANDKPLGPFFVGQDLARRDLAGINADGRRGDGSKPVEVCATYVDLFGPDGRQFAGLLKKAGR